MTAVSWHSGTITKWCSSTTKGLIVLTSAETSLRKSRFRNPNQAKEGEAHETMSAAITALDPQASSAASKGLATPLTGTPAIGAAATLTRTTSSLRREASAAMLCNAPPLMPSVRTVTRLSGSLRTWEWPKNGRGTEVLHKTASRPSALPLPQHLSCQ